MNGLDSRSSNMVSYCHSHSLFCSNPFPCDHVASVNLPFKPNMTAIILRRVIVCRAPWFFPAFFQIRSSTGECGFGDGATNLLDDRFEWTP